MSNIKTQQGLLSGFHEDNVAKYFGTPYAAPPVGDLRWRPPALASTWTGVRDAKLFGPVCPQVLGACYNLRQSQQSEDCLYLNVWTQTALSSLRMPVMVWIHGGGNLGGAGSEDAYDGTQLAKRGAVVVTINYRLGAFGYLAHPDVGANFAVQDQIAALRWVRDNISHFGGDPDMVLVFGQSAGAVAIRSLICCPQAAGLVHRAIMQSAKFEDTSLCPTRSLHEAHTIAERFLSACGSKDVETLRQASTEVILQVSHQMCGLPPPSGQVHTPNNLVWMPVVDDQILFQEPFDGWPCPIALMLGCTENEARYFLKPQLPWVEKQLENLAELLCGALSSAALELLIGEKDSLYDRFDYLFTSAIFLEPLRESLQRFSRFQQPVYHYHFARCPPGAQESMGLAKHTEEIPYVMGNLDIKGQNYYNEIDVQLSNALMDLWISFSRGRTLRLSGGCSWPTWSSESSQTLYIEDELRVGQTKWSRLVRLLHSLRQ